MHEINVSECARAHNKAGHRNGRNEEDELDKTLSNVCKQYKTFQRAALRFSALAYCEKIVNLAFELEHENCEIFTSINCGCARFFAGVRSSSLTNRVQKR